MTTKAEAQQRAAEMLKVVAIGQGVDSQIDTRLGEAYDEVYARLQMEGLAVWLSSAAMPDEITPHFVALMAENKMGQIPVSEKTMAEILRRTGNDGEIAIGMIRKYVNSAYEDNEPITDY